MLEPEVEAAKAASLGQVLFKSARLFNEQALLRLDISQLRVAHTQLLPHLSAEGIRATELARRIGISKQAVGELVDDLHALGLVARERDPADRRAVLITLTTHGQRAILHGLAVLAELREALIPAVGEDRLARLHDDLSVLLAALQGLTTSGGGGPQGKE